MKDLCQYWLNLVSGLAVPMVPVPKSIQSVLFAAIPPLCFYERSIEDMDGMVAEVWAKLKTPLISRRAQTVRSRPRALEYGLGAVLPGSGRILRSATKTAAAVAAAAAAAAAAAPEQATLLPPAYEAGNVVAIPTAQGAAQPTSLWPCILQKVRLVDSLCADAKNIMSAYSMHPMTCIVIIGAICVRPAKISPSSLLKAKS